MARVLVVDDALIMRKKMIASIVDLGHEIVGEAKNGEEAIAMYKTHKPDVVTMDITMDGMDGIEATKLICQEFVDAKIIMCSSHSNDETIAQAMGAGAKGYLVKPFSSEEFKNALEKIL